MYKIKLITSILIIFSLMMNSSFADTRRINGSPIIPPGANIKLPKYYPTYMIPTGKITKVLKKSQIIIVDGAAYKLHPIHNIYTMKKGVQATLYNLRRGMKIGFEFTTYRGKKVVNKIWILPENYPIETYAN